MNNEKQIIINPDTTYGWRVGVGSMCANISWAYNTSQFLLLQSTEGISNAVFWHIDAMLTLVR